MKARTEHRPPSWLHPDARAVWAKVAKQLWAREQKPTMLERVAAAIFAEELSLAQDESADNETRHFAFARARSLEVALKMEPLEQRRRTGS